MFFCSITRWMNQKVLFSCLDHIENAVNSSNCVAIYINCVTVFIFCVTVYIFCDAI